MSQIRCLYCDRPLALLKRLTGDGEFCSKEHRKNYQREHNELALARLLESQTVDSRAILRPAKPAESAPPPVEAAPVKTAPGKGPQQRPPSPANFLSEYPREARAVSGVLGFTGDPRFAPAPPAWKEAQPDPDSKDRGGGGGQPKVAVFLSEPLDPRSFAAAVLFPGKSTLRSPGPRLAETLPSNDSSIAVRRQPGGAGFVSEPPATHLSSGVVRHWQGPQFNLRAAAWGPEGAAAGIGRHRKLLFAAFLPGPPAAQSIAGGIQRIGGEPRWKPREPALPAQLAKIELVLGSFLRRPVRAVLQDGIPETFELPLRPLCFPPPSPGMAFLEQRLHRTDRIGFSPP